MNKNLKEELYRLIRYGEEKTDYQSESLSILQIIEKEQEFFKYKKEFSKEVYEQMKQQLDFITFYFRYNAKNSYDTVIDLSYDQVTKVRREIILTFINDYFEIKNKEKLTQEELEVIEKNREFYEQLTLFGIEQNLVKLVISSVSKDFSVNLYNNYLELTSPYYEQLGIYLYINYSYDQEHIRSRFAKRKDSPLDRIYLGSKRIYDTKEGLFEFNTDSYAMRKILTKNDCENMLHLLDSVHIYKEDLPSRITNSNVKKKILTK